MSIYSDHQDSGSEDDARYTVEKQPLFEIKTSVLHLTPAVDNYQEKRLRSGKRIHQL